MLDALKSLFENNVISEEIRAEIQEAWDKKVTETKLTVTAELREEFASKYEHDKAQMVEAIDSMVSEKLAEEISEFTDDRKNLAEARAKYVIAMRENANLLKEFVMQSLKKEVTELHEDQKVMATNFAKLEDFVVDALSKEIAEFHEDKKDVTETKVRLIREAKAHFEKVRQKFIQKGASKVSEIVGRHLKKEISQLKDDIDASRKNDFGRRLFESYAQEYTNSFLNSKSETAKLLKVVDVTKQQLEDAKSTANEKEKIIDSKQVEIDGLKTKAEREAVVNELVTPLNTEQKEIMTNLLESVSTGKLRKQFDKYMPSVINGRSPAKKASSTIGTEVTGDKIQTNIGNVSQFNRNIVDIKRLAGI